MKTLGEALEAFTKEEVVSFKWDKEVNTETGAPYAVIPLRDSTFAAFTAFSWIVQTIDDAILYDRCPSVW